MASRAVFIQRKYLQDLPSRSSRLIRFFAGFEHSQASAHDDRSSFSHLASNSSSNIDDRVGGSCDVKKLLSEFSTLMPLKKHKLFGVSRLDSGFERRDFISPFGATRMLDFVRHTSTATADQPESSSDKAGRKQQATKQIKEASPEDCDQAVEGLSSVKARAKAKQIQEPQKSDKSIVKRIWAVLLGIGPALRALASMSRLFSL